MIITIIITIIIIIIFPLSLPWRQFSEGFTDKHVTDNCFYVVVYFILLYFGWVVLDITNLQ